MAFKVGDKVIAVKDRPLSYNVTTDKVVCEVIEVLNSGFIIVVVLDDEGGCDFTVDPQYFKPTKPRFKGNK
jgi:hypothetical protein